MADNSSSSSINLFACSKSKGAFWITTSFVITNLLLILPLSLLVLHLGLQRWRQQRSLATSSHSDVFTYHFVVMELMFVLGFAFFVCGDYFGLEVVKVAGSYLFAAFYPGQICFHILTCVERYLAVVHPVTYLALRRSGGVRIRNVSVGCAWLLYCGWMGVEALSFPDVPYVTICCFLAVSLAVVSFCSFAVLCVLIRPSPGEAGKEVPRVDQSKQRAFHTITAITAVLWMFFIGVFLCVVLNFTRLGASERCVLLSSGSWCSFPSSLVLPLLFLQRAGKLVCCHSKG